jgi:hypothetical protein
MKLITQFWESHKQARNLANLVVILPVFIYGGVNYYVHFIQDSSMSYKVLFVLFYLIIAVMLFFRPYLVSYKTENIITDLKCLGNKRYDITVQLKSSTTLILGRKLMRIKCAPTSKVTYTLKNEELSDYKQGDKLILLLGADTQVRKILV